jgi:PPOX class probable F420-dependent enzyme
MTPELQNALKRHMQWFGSYKKSGELVKVQVWLIVHRGRIEFLTGKDSYKVRRLRRNPRAICYVGSKNGPAVPGTAEIIRDKADIARVYRAYWKTHPVFMLLGIGLRIWIEMLMGNRVVVRVEPDQPNALVGVNE